MSLRLFVGVALPGDHQKLLGAACESVGKGLASRVRWVRPGNGHLTLKFLGEVDDENVDDICKALAAVRFGAFVVQFAGAGMFPPKGPPQVLWAGLDKGAKELGRLAREVGEALLPLGFTSRGHAFRPHLTLGRIKRAKNDPWERVLWELSRISWPSYRVNEFTLWRSVLGPQGPKYSAMADFGATSL